ncbi:MAG: thiamine-phosphate kinase [Polyangiaceae bacterium]
MARAPELSEFTAIPRLAKLFRSDAALVAVGIGDDAALLQLAALAPKSGLVWTVDTAVEHVHFERTWLSLADLGWRSFHAAASDVSAMGGAPLAALSSVIFPARFGASELEQVARGQRAAARALSCSVVGGNLSRGAELSITTTVLGRAPRPLLRSAARVGDELWLCGDVGLSAAGLRLLQRGTRQGKGVAERRALAAFRRPRAQLKAGIALSGRARAAIDISDGLAGDAAHVAQASKVRLVIELDALEAALTPALRRLGPELGVSALELALYGGEDYALLATGPARSRPAGARVIGRVDRGQGVWLALSKAGRLIRAGSGFEHSGGRMPPRVGP